MSSETSHNVAQPLSPRSIARNVVYGRTVVPVPLYNKAVKRGTYGEFAEHGFIGDAIELTLAGGDRVPAVDHPFELENGLVVTYGQINGLAGDFYGTSKPISDGQDAEERAARFIAAYDTLAAPRSRQPKEAQDILRVLQTEVDAVNDALRDHKDPSVAYSTLPDVSLKLQWLTMSRPNIPSYLGLSLISWDHFGSDARTAYNAGHATALQAAADGDLERAYTLNAFADHYLEDSFSAGHLRVPRRGLSSQQNIFYDVCCKLMHDEDCAIGLKVKNPAGESWTCYGDKRVLDKEDAENLKRCVAAVQASADEVYEAFVTKTVPPSGNYKAWSIAPTLASARALDQASSALFRYTDAEEKAIERRSILTDRRIREYTTSWKALRTSVDCLSSGWWRYPITIDGPPKALSSTVFAVTILQDRSSRLYHQSPLGGILENVFIDGQWKEVGDLPLVVDAMPFTPLAAIGWDYGNQIRVYYLGADYTLQEYCYVDGDWTLGALGALNISASTDTSIAALQYEDGDGVHIRVYFQEAGCQEIQEFRNDGSWVRGAILPTALGGTRIAAAVCDSEGVQVRVYYQAPDLYILEHCLSDNEWYPGSFSGDEAPRQAQIGAIFSGPRGDVPEVYWMNVDNDIIRSVLIDGCWHTSKVVGPLISGAWFAPVQWDNGKDACVYFQAEDNNVFGVYKDDDGEWYSARVAMGEASGFEKAG
ncbi:fungal fucose-specific lectin-domain-containing protein [Cubamyces lactineus]|nr:fungal fucose-specific lectin-domain-containing protein [Cubamyces lactineus]